MGNYEILIDGVPVQVKLADNKEAISQAINKISSLYRVVGLDYQKAVTTGSKCSHDLLVLCGGDNGYCLIIDLEHLETYFQDLLINILRDEDNCIVHASPSPSAYNNFLGDYNAIKSIEAGEFAARVLNKPDLKGLKLAQIAREVGVLYEDLKGLSQDLNKIVVGKEYPSM